MSEEYFSSLPEPDETVFGASERVDMAAVGKEDNAKTRLAASAIRASDDCSNCDAMSY